MVFSGGDHLLKEELDELPTLPDGWTIPNMQTKEVILVRTRRRFCWLPVMDTLCVPGWMLATGWRQHVFSAAVPQACMLTGFALRTCT